MYYFVKLFWSHFLLNSRYPQFCDNFYRLPHKSYSLFRSYGVILPSSFNIILSSVLIYSICLPVSVYSTVFYFLQLFLETNKKLSLLPKNENNLLSLSLLKIIKNLLFYPSKRTFVFFLGTDLFRPKRFNLSLET